MNLQQVAFGQPPRVSWQPGCINHIRWYKVNASNIDESSDLCRNYSPRGTSILVSGAFSWSVDRALTLRLLSCSSSSRLRDESESPRRAWDDVGHLSVHPDRRP